MNNKLIFILVLVGAAAIFILQNAAVAEIRFLFWSVQMSRSLLMLFLVAIGIIIGWFLHSYYRHRKS